MTYGAKVLCVTLFLEAKRILDPDFVLVHMTGMREPKVALLDAVEDGTLNDYTEETDAVDNTCEPCKNS